VKEVSDRNDVRFLELARDLIVRWAALLKAVGLYEAENNALRAVCDKIRAAVSGLLDGGADLELAIREDSIFIAGQRVRESAVASSSYHLVIDILRAARIGAFRLDEDVTTRELQLFASLIVAVVRGDKTHADLESELKVHGVAGIEITPLEGEDSLPEMNAKEMAQRIDLRTIGVLFLASLVMVRLNTRLRFRRLPVSAVQ
jgi:hypothetical protein